MDNRFCILLVYQHVGSLAMVYALLCLDLACDSGVVSCTEDVQYRHINSFWPIPALLVFLLPEFDSWGRWLFDTGERMS